MGKNATGQPSHRVTCEEIDVNTRGAVYDDGSPQPEVPGIQSSGEYIVAHSMPQMKTTPKQNQEAESLAVPECLLEIQVMAGGLCGCQPTARNRKYHV